MNPKCEYGCGKEANYQLKNQKWCCSESQNSCVNIRNKNSESHIGNEHSPETRQKLSESRKKNIGWNHNIQTVEKISKGREKYCTNNPGYMKGDKKFGSPGDKHPNWKGGITKERTKVWHSFEYQDWRTKVFVRDKYVCQACGAKNNFNAHHIKTFSDYPELRFDVNNGITLCVDCHRLTFQKEEQIESLFLLIIEANEFLNQLNGWQQSLERR